MDSENKILRYNWYETNLAKFLTKYSLPIEYDGDFLKFLRKTHKKFLGDFKSILINGGISKLHGRYLEGNHQLIIHLVKKIN